MYDISIIVPIYNMDWCLKEHISLLPINNCNCEIILVNDGSSDNSAAICDSFKAANVKVIHKQNGGISSARNCGLDVATGKYIYFYDPDDIVEIGLFNEVAFDSADMIVFGYVAEYFNDGKIVKNINYCSNDRMYYRKEFEEYLGLDTKIQFPIWNKVFRRDVIEENSIRFPCIGCWEDACFVMQYIRCSRSVSLISKIYYHYRIEQTRESLSKLRYVEDRKKQYLTLFEENEKTLKELRISNTQYYISNCVRLVYNAAYDFFYNTTIDNIEFEIYKSYYNQLFNFKNFKSVINNRTVRKRLKIFEAKAFCAFYDIYDKINNIHILIICHKFIINLLKLRK